MVVAVTEVIDVVARYCIQAIIKSTLPCPLHCPCKVCFQGRCAGVKHRHHVRVVCPDISKVLLHRLVSEWFKWQPSRLRAEVHGVELNVRNSPAENALNNICSVKAIHAIGSHHSLLLFENTAIVDVIGLCQAMCQLRPERTEKQ